MQLRKLISEVASEEVISGDAAIDALIQSIFTVLKSMPAEEMDSHNEDVEKDLRKVLEDEEQVLDMYKQDINRIIDNHEANPSDDAPAREMQQLVDEILSGSGK